MNKWPATWSTYSLMLNSSYRKKKSSQAIDSLAVFDCTLEAGDS